MYISRELQNGSYRYTMSIMIIGRGDGEKVRVWNSRSSTVMKRNHLKKIPFPARST